VFPNFLNTPWRGLLVSSQCNVLGVELEIVLRVPENPIANLVHAKHGVLQLAFTRTCQPSSLKLLVSADFNRTYLVPFTQCREQIS